ncbi:hypothetical protein COS53_04030 [Candidatus Shapirobacteria bacterium CG03_land_8_20_14_0_80_35_14]|uniref:Glycosyltransferase RgtA/B/C/D-like domain-containing protein n=1 Tax=Candidatus Shapirobacteria bacterium CG03_land_8_20_14_0_80_35_14 TaxID=1974878 RepID=A0A2M7BMC7_9BACT|nr:MAG: hypothetical protein COS53_04030 [Candidatus Shapirobacteria bacterium CG03_land_8_20_14_0_80_35_14]
MKNKIPILLFLGISLLYFFTRLQHLTSIPVFGDEAIYLHWSQIIKNVETLRFISLNDGKQPLYMWLVVPLLKLFPTLVAGRLLSILAGYFILILLIILFAIYQNFSSKNKEPHLFLIESLTKNIYSNFIPALIYLFLPFSFFFDRLAIPDNLLSAFGLLTIIFALLLAKYPRLDLSMLLGLSLGLAWITKSPAIYFVVLSLLIFVFLGNYKKILYPIISVFISFCIYNLLRLGPQFHQIALRNLDYIWPISEIIRHPLDPLVPHLRDLNSLSAKFISLPLILLLFINFKKINKLFFVLLLTFILPLISNLAITKVFTGRYILFSLPYLIVLMSLGFLNLSKKFKYTLFFILLIFIPNIYYQYQLSVNPFTIGLPNSESGYLSGWTSGWGIENISQYLIEQSKASNVIVGTEGYFGTFPDGLQIYTNDIPHLTVFGVDNDLVKIPEKLIDARNHGDDVYVIKNSSKNNFIPSDLIKLSLINTYLKPDGSTILLYQLL